MSSLKEVVAIVRSFSDPNIGRFVNSLLKYLPVVIVVVPAEIDAGFTRGVIEKDCERQRGRVHIIETLVKDGPRSWSALLNTGLAFAKGMNAGGSKFKYIFSVSNTTCFTEHDVWRMLKYFDQSPAVGIVGATFIGINEDGMKVNLGKSYNLFPKNTGMLIRMSVFEGHPILAGFDPYYDGRNGMEDYAFGRIAQNKGLWAGCRIDVRVPVKVGVHWNQAEKEKFMRRGIRDVDKRLKALGL